MGGVTWAPRWPLALPALLAQPLLTADWPRQFGSAHFLGSRAPAFSGLVLSPDLRGGFFSSPLSLVFSLPNSHGAARILLGPLQYQWSSSFCACLSSVFALALDQLRPSDASRRAAERERHILERERANYAWDVERGVQVRLFRSAAFEQDRALRSLSDCLAQLDAILTLQLANSRFVGENRPGAFSATVSRLR